jgi:mannan endo-1,4-beta-mannosidase
VERRVPGRRAGDRRLGSPAGLDGAWTFGNGQQVTQSWGATITADGSAVTARNVAYNGTVAAGASTAFGFLGSWNGTNAVPSATCTAA